MAVSNRSSFPPFAASSSSRGGVLLEFAIVLPFLFLILAGAVDFGLTIREQATLVEAARTGARAASRTNALTPDAKRDLALAAAKSSLTLAGQNVNDFQFNISPNTQNGVLFVRVAISRPTGSRVFIRAANQFNNCVGSVFRVEDNIAPTTLTENANCA